ncbi:hypothetical protein BDW68DRAFT_189949 [Aspergillus falconensis]
MSASETTPLLPPSPSPSPLPIKEKNNKHVFYVCLITLFIINGGAAMSVPPTTSILQDLLCERHYAQQGLALTEINELDCRIEPVQSSLSMLRGVVGLLMLLPGLVLAVPYAALAERWGVKRVLLLSVAGIVLGEVWFDLVCWLGREWPLQLVYLAPVAYLVGGGPAVGGTPTRFFFMEASAYSGIMLGYMASSAIMNEHLWASVVLGPGLVFASFFLALLFPDERPVSGKGGANGEPGSAPASEAKSTLYTIRTAMVVFQEQGGLVVILLGYVLRCLGNSVMTLLIIYASQVFDWSFSQSGYLLSLHNATHLAVLLLLPAVDRLLARAPARERQTELDSAGPEAGLSKHFSLARGSALLSAVGSAGMALARSPFLFVTSLILYGLGSGYTQSIRSILTLSTREEHRAITYSVLGIMEAAGTLAGAPFWPLMYQLGLKVGEDGFWVGLPFLITAALMGVVWATLDRSSWLRSLYDPLHVRSILAINAYFIFIVFLFERQLRSPALRNRVSLPADVLELLAIATAAALSYIHHCRSIRPSTLLILFLSVRSLLGIARVRTLWLISGVDKAAIPFTTGLVMTLLCAVLESTGKASSLVAAGESGKAVPATPEPFSGLWKRASFAWLSETFRRGYVRVLSVDDLPELDPVLDSEAVGERLEYTWATAGFTFCQPFLISATVSWVGMPDAPADSGKALIGAFALVYVGLAVCTALYGYQNFRFVIRLRGGLISLIHKQTMHARAVDLGETTAITLMGTDVERIVSGFRSIHELWASLTEVGIAVYLLERQVGVACSVPAVIVVVFISATFKVSSLTNKFQRLWIEKVEDRLRLTSYTLENIKAVKMLGLSEKIFTILQGLRHAEIATSAVFRKLLIGTITLSNSPADLAPMATFAVYVIIALVRNNDSILAAQAFTSLSLISLDMPGLAGDRQKGELVTLTNHTVTWKKNATPVLHEINLTIRRGITMIIGPIGSGKSTLLESILGETLVTSGHTERISPGPVAYCSQTPWLQSQSIKANIIGASPIDEAWYRTVISACGLEKDLSQLPRGDATEAGNSGMTLSGGQKQRIALSRALYSRAKIIILDDVFSGIDAAGTESYLLPYADEIVILGDGQVVEKGNLEDLRARSAFVQGLQTSLPTSTSSAVDSKSSETAEATSAPSGQNETEDEQANETSPSENDELLNHESPSDPTRRNGDLSVYTYYQSGWTGGQKQMPNPRTPKRAWGKKELIYVICRAPLQFFQRVDIGSITNRFSQDMDLIDMPLPIEALNCLAAVCTCLLKLLILCVFAKYLAATIPFILITVYFTQSLYLRTSRQMRLLDIEAKAPLYTHFIELVSGAATIRAFKWHASFQNTVLRLLNFSQRPVYFLYCIQQCLGFVLDILVAILAVILVATVVFLRDKFEAGDVGVALVMVMTFNSNLMHLVKFWTAMETSIGAVKRVKEYVRTTEPEENDAYCGRLAELPQSWPDNGEIRFEGVVAGHLPTSPPILKNLTLSISPGSKVAINGSIIIDGLDLAGYPREEIRRRLNVVTQDPFLVPGSVRFNIDPWGHVPDERIVAALKRVGLWDVLVQHEGKDREDKGGLELDIQINANMFSVGQRQLLCLARALVRPGKVLILDEATSSVDHATESTMQSILETDFSSHTILSVLHRLRYIHRYDKVAVLDAGRVVEFDKPSVLLKKEGSRFKELYRSGEYDVRTASGGGVEGVD